MIQGDMRSPLLRGASIAYMVRTVNEKNRKARPIIKRLASMIASTIFACKVQKQKSCHSW